MGSRDKPREGGVAGEGGRGGEGCEFSNENAGRREKEVLRCVDTVSQRAFPRKAQMMGGDQHGLLGYDAPVAFVGARVVVVSYPSSLVSYCF